MCKTELREYRQYLTRLLLLSTVMTVRGVRLILLLVLKQFREMMKKSNAMHARRSSPRKSGRDMAGKPRGRGSSAV
jgi:hypothetical protein